MESYTSDAGIIFSNNNNDIYLTTNGIVNEDISDDELFCDAEDDNKSLDVEVDGNSVNFIESETEDSEYDSDDKRVLSPRRKAPPIESLEEMFLKHDFTTFTLKEKEFDETEP